MTKIQNKIMRRVYLIWFSKRILPYVLFEVFMFSAFLYIVGEYTFVRVIAENLTRLLFSDPSALMRYFAEAALNTKFVVQASMIGASAAIILAFKNIIAVFVQFGIFREETNIKRGVFY